MSKTTKILLKRSTVAGKAPTAEIMEPGEAFVNIADGAEHLYFKNTADEVVATKLGPLDKELDETSEYGVENQAIAKKYNELKKQLDLISQIYSIYGFARVNGDNSPNGTIFFGEDSNLKEITSHFHMGLTMKNGKLYKRCANCRLDVAADGTELKIDGTNGDVMLFTDSDLYFLKGTVAAPTDLNLGDGVELNIIALGMSPFRIYNVNAKKFSPFALNPQYTVNCNINGIDDVVCAHSIFNTKYAGTYTKALGWFNETFKPNGNGYPNQNISSMQSIWYAQGKNANQKTNRPYMGGYYEFFEIFLALMFCELKSVYHQLFTSFGTGCTNLGGSIKYFNQMSAYSGIMYVTKDGTKRYGNLTRSITIANGSDSSNNPIEGLVGSSIYGFTEMLEPDRILNDIAKAGLINKIWDGVTADSQNASVVFEYDDEGNMKVSDFTNEELATGANMTPNHKYYQVRSVPNVMGMSDGAMTAVINIYVKMTFKDGTTVNNVNYTGGYVVYKMSHPVYRGMCLMDGMFKQMQGGHYVNYCDMIATIGDDVKAFYTDYFKCAENVDDLPAQEAASIEYFGDVDKDLAMERGLTKVVQTREKLTLSQKRATTSWAKKADYNASLMCYTQGGAGISTGECAFLLNNASWSNGDTNTTDEGLPTAGRKCVNAFSLGCYSMWTYVSARTVDSNLSVNDSTEFLAGAFAIPHLSL